MLKQMRDWFGFSNTIKKVSLKEFPDHFSPEPGTKYFLQKKHTHTDVVSVIYPFFNEEMADMDRSLKSMMNQTIECNEYGDYDFKVVAIMDGWEKASESMKEYMKQLYPDENPKKWWEYVEEQAQYKDKVDTFVLERVNERGDFIPVELPDGGTLNLSLIIKLDNRRKANSHEWFFQAFAKEVESEYAFATDCGTLYGDDCVSKLLKYMEDHDECAGATGRQRVMSPGQQGAENEGLLEMWYRAAQAYDYETSISSFQGAFSLAGMLPVLPGPCGLYRMKDIAGDCLEYYFDTVKSAASGMLFGNLLLAEDRILSYAASLKTGKFTRWVPSAVFYFEAETQSVNFIAQRRRWTNGAFAGYLYLLFSDPKLLWYSSHSIGFKFANFALLGMQMLMFVLTVVSPALFASMVYYSIDILEFFGDANVYVKYVFLGITVVMYMTYTTVHFNRKFCPQVYYINMLWNTVCVILVLTGIGSSILRYDITMIIVAAFTVLIPFILALMHDFIVAVMVLVNMIPYLIMLPTFVFSFPSYAYARTWDMSWGNRPSENGEIKKKEIKNMVFKGKIILISIQLVNLSMTGLFIGLMPIKYFIYLSIGMLVPSIIQQVLSFFYFMLYTPNTLLDKVWLSSGENLPKLMGNVFAIASFVLFNLSIWSGRWIEETKAVFSEDGKDWWGTVNTQYGLLFTCTEVIHRNVDIGMIPTDYGCSVWGEYVIDDWPSVYWTISLLCLAFSVILGFITVVSIFSSFFMIDKTRNDNINVLYTMTISIVSTLSCLLFPLGFVGKTYSRGQIYPDAPICTDGSFYNMGKCDWAGYGFWTLVAGCVTSIISHYLFVRSISRNKQQVDNNIKMQKKMFILGNKGDVAKLNTHEYDDIANRLKSLETALTPISHHFSELSNQTRSMTSFVIDTDSASSNSPDTKRVSAPMKSGRNRSMSLGQNPTSYLYNIKDNEDRRLSVIA